MLGGFVAGAAEHGFTVVPTIARRATPSGRVDASALSALGEELTVALEAAMPADGLLLELHGAMTAEGTTAADGQLAEIARAAVGDVPIVTVVDPHANLSARLLTAVDALLAYQENPHVDMAACGQAAADLLERIMRTGERPACAAARVPVVAPAIAQASSDQPIAGMLAAARRLAEEPEVVNTAVLFGYPYADTPDTGMAALALASDTATAEATALELADRCWESRHRFDRHLNPPSEAIALAERSCGGLVVLTDTGDNVGGGAYGNSPVLLQAALKSSMRVTSTFRDPWSAIRARKAGLGATVPFRLGTIALQAVVRGLHHGRFVHDGPLSAGVEFDMGPAAVLQIGRLTLIVHTDAVMPNDQSLFRSCGIDLGRVDAIILKGAAAVRAGWASRADSIIDVATPGATTSDLWQLPLQQIPRPMFPLDDFAWEPSSDHLLT